MQKYTKNIKDKTMPGYGKMPQDKDYKSKKAMKDGQDTLNTMQPRKGGIYMDREDGKLPADRVAKYYQETNPKMEQMKEIKQGLKNVKAGFEYGGKQFMDEAKDIYKSLKSGTSTAIEAGKEGLKKVGNFITSFDDRSQPTSNIKKRGGNSILYQDKK